jgi:hypothetical protein
MLLLLFVGLTLSGCANSYSGDAEQYKRDHDRYMRTHEPKTGGPDI